MWDFQLYFYILASLQCKVCIWKRQALCLCSVWIHTFKLICIDGIKTGFSYIKTALSEGKITSGCYHYHHYPYACVCVCVYFQFSLQNLFSFGNKAKMDVYYIYMYSFSCLKPCLRSHATFSSTLLVKVKSHLLGYISVRRLEDGVCATCISKLR